MGETMNTEPEFRGRTCGECDHGSPYGDDHVLCGVVMWAQTRYLKNVGASELGRIEKTAACPAFVLRETP
jgi:hypothetical protein